MGHANNDLLLKSIHLKLFTGYKLSNRIKIECISCLKGHAKAIPVPQVRHTRATIPGQIIHMDLTFNLCNESLLLVKKFVSICLLKRNLEN